MTIKNMKKLLLFTLLLTAFTVVSAQNKKLTVEDAILKRFSTLAPDDLSQLTWLPGTNEFVYVDKAASVIKRGKAGSSNQLVFVRLADLNKAMKGMTEKDSTFNSFPYLMWENNRSFQFYYGGAYYAYDTKKKNAEKLMVMPSGAEEPNYEMEHTALTYKLGNDLFIIKDGKTHKPLPLTGEQVNLGMVASRNEMGISKGVFWGNSGKYIAFFAVNEELVTDYPIYNLNEKPATDRMIKYPVAGESSQVVHLGIYNFETEKTNYLIVKKDSFDYLTNIVWGPNDEFIYLALVNRGQNHVWFQKYNAATGELEADLFEEKNEKYVEPENDMIFNPVNGEQFLWFSERDGYNHLYLYNVDGELIKQVTKGEWVVTEFHGFDKKGKTIYVTTTKDGALNRTVYAVDIASGAMTKLTGKEGTNSVSFNDECSFFINRYQALTVPKVISISNSSGVEVNTLLTSKDPLAEYKLGSTEFITLKADDGTELYARIIKPIDFDPNKKYPCITYVYGGPHVQLVRNLWLGGADLWMNYMAQQGYVVFTIDSRGSDNRGHKFESATHRQLGTLEIKDQQVGANYLKSLSYVDADRMAIFGWSFGGFMTTSLMTRTPDTYKVGVAGGPVIDWRYYEVMYTERYMDSPQENPEGYETANLLNYVKDLKGRLLIIHGTSDDVVLWQHSLLYVKKAVEEGVLLDYFVYPHHPHNVIGKDRAHLYKKITDYIERNL